ncbi:MAG: hypothetical protein R3311_20065, partial [Oceanisphaera sp.]|nr:hypothetical protein [Oceanisphaera sp.]
MANGVPILGTMTKKCPVVKEGPNLIRMTLVQGLNRQIRRMCEYFGYEVVKLERVRIMNVSLKGLALGDWRDLTEQELTELLKAVEDSSSEAPEGRRSQGARNSQARSKPAGDRQGAKKQPGKRPVKSGAGQQAAGKSAAQPAGRGKAAAAKGKRPPVKPTTGKGAVKGGKLSGKVAARAAAAAAKGKGKGAVKAKPAGKGGAKGGAPKGKKPARRG